MEIPSNRNEVKASRNDSDKMGGTWCRPPAFTGKKAPFEIWLVGTAAVTVLIISSLPTKDISVACNVMVDRLTL